MAQSPTVKIMLPIDPRLKAAICKHADKRGLKMNELVAQVVAKVLRVPYGKIPRLPMGRPRKDQVRDRKMAVA